MKLDVIPEPELQFAAGRHIDIRYGLTHLGAFDRDQPLARERIRVGIVGTARTVEGVARWLDRCRKGIAAKESRLVNLFVAFPGYGAGASLKADLVTDATIQRAFSERAVVSVAGTKNRNALVRSAVELFLPEVTSIAEKGGADVIICAVPLDLLTRMWEDSDSGNATAEDAGGPLDFHHMLKACAMRNAPPLQIVLPMTYDESIRLPQKARPQRERKLQDEATRAWNLYVALYYKAGGTPWRLVRDAAQLTTCFVGVSFYEALDGSALRTSSAQVFNERGEGLILRGGPVAISKVDRRPHLTSETAAALLKDALQVYRGEHRTLPARVVVQKTSGYINDELAGFTGALNDLGVESYDLLSLRPSSTRVFRRGQYPPLRGTFLSKDAREHVLYTRGSVEFFKTYPGMYVPHPLAFTCDVTDQAPRFLAAEILALTKMNWNATQFDNSDPIVVRAATTVGRILKYVEPDVAPQRKYSYYM